MLLSNAAISGFNKDSASFTVIIAQSVKCIATEESKSFVSGLLRGYFGRLLGNNAWLAALQSARVNKDYSLFTE